MKEVCVCVREPSELNRGKTSCLFLVFNSRFKLAGKYSIPTLSIFKFAGGRGIHTIRDHVQRSYLIVWDTEPDQLYVPVFQIHFLHFFQIWHPVKPRTGKSFLLMSFSPISELCAAFMSIFWPGVLF